MADFVAAAQIHPHCQNLDSIRPVGGTLDSASSTFLKVPMRRVRILLGRVCYAPMLGTRLFMVGVRVLLDVWSASVVSVRLS